ncbi:NAD-dependent epimerase/dehydratase family protein [Patulibacter sp. NPDC049589]|uniref:NAD-dependent epimerase/dehydratase family protein n=1 Tax=Patulibacter sp. NPDC049589 TaxID=3154731 RepID=UPI00341F0607
MNIFLTGATGYVGSGVLSALTSAGHAVTALVRTDEAAAAVRRDGVEPVIGTMGDAALITALARDTDGVIHTASPGDETSPAAEDALAAAVLAGLGERDAAFIRTGGIWVHGSGAAITEATPRNAPPLVAWREEIDTRVLATPGVRSILVEPGIVYGRGGGIPNMVVGAGTSGDPAALELIGDGTQHWSTVHVDDLGELYVAALERGAAGSTFLGASGSNPTSRELGEAASRARGLDGRVVPEAPERTVERLGAFGEALLLDQQATGAHAREALGWEPTRPSLVDEIERGSYRRD